MHVLSGLPSHPPCSLWLRPPLTPQAPGRHWAGGTSSRTRWAAPRPSDYASFVREAGGGDYYCQHRVKDTWDVVKAPPRPRPLTRTFRAAPPPRASLPRSCSGRLPSFTFAPSFHLPRKGKSPTTFRGKLTSIMIIRISTFLDFVYTEIRLLLAFFVFCFVLYALRVSESVPKLRKVETIILFWSIRKEKLNLNNLTTETQLVGGCDEL